MSAVIGVDQGTSSTKATLISDSGIELESITLPVPTPYSNGQNRFQDPDALVRSVQIALDTLIDFASSKKIEISAIGISCQRSGVLVWDSRTKEVLHPMLSWQDTSTLPALNALGEATEIIPRETGLPVNGHYAGGKFAVLQQRFKRSEEIVGMLETFILHRLSGVLCTADTFAARTMLYDLRKGEWSKTLCELLAVDYTRLPDIRATTDSFGDYRGVPITVVIGDQQSAFHGIAYSKSDPILVLGSVASIIAPTGQQIAGLPGYIASLLNSTGNSLNRKRYFQIEATTNCAGFIPDLIVRKLALVPVFKEIDAACSTALREYSQDAPIVFAPFGNTATPDWRSDLPDLLAGAIPVRNNQLVLALMDNLAAFLVFDMKAFITARLISPEKNTICASGGGSRFTSILQFIADCTGITISQSASEKGSAYGAALLAGGIEPPPPAEARRIHPEGSSAPERYQRWLALRDKAYQGTYEIRESEYFGKYR